MIKEITKKFEIQNSPEEEIFEMEAEKNGIPLVPEHEYSEKAMDAIEIDSREDWSDFSGIKLADYRMGKGRWILIRYTINGGQTWKQRHARLIRD